MSENWSYVVNNDGLLVSYIVFYNIWFLYLALIIHQYGRMQLFCHQSNYYYDS